jgi:hypothetical protein
LGGSGSEAVVNTERLRSAKTGRLRRSSRIPGSRHSHRLSSLVDAIQTLKLRSNQNFEASGTARVPERELSITIHVLLD